MARSRFSIALAICCTAILAVPLAIVSAVERAVAFVFALFPASAERPAFAFDFADRQVAFAGDVPVDAFVSNSLRHEAGMRRLT